MLADSSFLVQQVILLLQICKEAAQKHPHRAPFAIHAHLVQPAEDDGGLVQQAMGLGSELMLRRCYIPVGGFLEGINHQTNSMLQDAPLAVLVAGGRLALACDKKLN